MWNGDDICTIHNFVYPVVIAFHDNVVCHKLIQSENARCEHLIIRIGADASFSKELTWITAFQRGSESLKKESITMKSV
jgi:hypothetical protein